MMVRPVELYVVPMTVYKRGCSLGGAKKGGGRASRGESPTWAMASCSFLEGSKSQTVGLKI